MDRDMNMASEGEGMSDGFTRTKGKDGQTLIQAQAVDKSSAGSDMKVNWSMKGGPEYLGHSIKGVSAVQDGNGANKGRKSTLD